MKKFEYYSYPKLLMQLPVLIHLIYLFNWVHQLRKWYCYPQLKKMMKQLPKGAVVVDYGCGEGQYLLPFAKQFPHLKFVAIDRNEQTINFVKAYSHQFKLKNVTGVCADIELESYGVKADLAICIGMLQYVKSPENVVSKMMQTHQLFLYQPVGYKMLTKWYRYLKQHYHDYDVAENIQHFFTTQSLQQLVAPFASIRLKVHTYGWMGKLALEITNSIIILFTNVWMLFRPLLVILFLLLLPVCWILMLGDVLQKRKTDGNGLMMVLSEKTLN